MDRGCDTEGGPETDGGVKGLGLGSIPYGLFLDSSQDG